MSSGEKARLKKVVALENKAKANPGVCSPRATTLTRSRFSWARWRTHSPGRFSRGGAARRALFTLTHNRSIGLTRPPCAPPRAALAADKKEKNDACRARRKESGSVKPVG